jgi:hypothetical protein
MDYEHISQVFDRLESRFGWERIKEGNLTIGVKLDGQSVTLEPGGQFELSGAPLETLHQTCAEVNSHLYQVKTIGEELGIGFLGLGFDPQWRIQDIPIMPKDRWVCDQTGHMVVKMLEATGEQPSAQSAGTGSSSSRSQCSCCKRAGVTAPAQSPGRFLKRLNHNGMQQRNSSCAAAATLAAVSCNRTLQHKDQQPQQRQLQCCYVDHL